MTRRHADGLFEADIPGVDHARAAASTTASSSTSSGGEAVELDDPYRFGRITTDYDLHLFGEGQLLQVQDRLGAHPTSLAASAACTSPSGRPTRSASRSSATSTGGTAASTSMRHLLPSGVWELFVPGLAEGERYKFEIRTPAGHLLHKVDPYGRYFEVPPRSAAIVCRTDGYAWGDDAWMADRLRGRRRG